MFIAKAKGYKLNILCISSLYPSKQMPDFGVFVKRRIEAMSRQSGVKITLLTPYPDSWLRRLIPKYKDASFSISSDESSSLVNRIPVKFCSIPGCMKIIEALSAKSWLKKHANSLWSTYGPFDVIDVHWGFPDLDMGIWLAQLWQIPINFTLRGMETFYEDDWRGKLISHRLKLTDGVISLSEEMRSHALSKNKELISSVILNGADTDRFCFKSQREARKENAIPTDHIMFLGVGSLIKRKGFHHALNAIAPIIKNDEPNLHYYIIGKPGPEGDFSDELIRSASALGIEDNVHFVGHVSNENLPIWYQCADWFVLSSSGEGSPNVLSEAMACGCFAISSPVGSAVDLIGRGTTGNVLLDVNFVNENDAAEALSKAIRQILEHSPRKSEKQRQEQAHALSAFGWDNCAQQAIEHLRLLCD